MNDMNDMNGNGKGHVGHVGHVMAMISRTPLRPDLSALGPSQAVLSKRMEHVWDAQCHAMPSVSCVSCGHAMPRYAKLSANTAVNRHLTYLTNVTMHNHPEEMRVKQQKDAALASRGLGRHKEQLPRSA